MSLGERSRGSSGGEMLRRGRRSRRNTGDGRDTKKAGRLTLFTMALISACAIVSGIAALDAAANSGGIRSGVEVAGVPLGGQTRDEAARTLANRLEGGLGTVRLTGRDEVSLSPEELGASYDVNETVASAYAVGREGGLLSRIGQRLSSGVATYEIPFVVDYEREVARDRIEELARNWNQPSRDASVGVSGAEVFVEDSQSGYELDVSATLANVSSAVENLGDEARIVAETSTPEIATVEANEAAQKARRAMSGPLLITSGDREWDISPAEVGTALQFKPGDGGISVSLRKGGLGEYMGEVYETLNVRPEEAGFVFADDGSISVTESAPGRAIQDDKFFDRLSSGIFEGRREFEVPISVEQADLTTEEARLEKPTDVIGSYETNYLSYDDTQGRVENLDISSQAVNGTVVAPGEVFSFNALAEPLDYYDTKVIVNGRADTAEGGGLCQVSSTLYMAANLAGMETVERQPHYAELPYIRPGFDATVWFGAIDYKFKNTTENYILIREWVDRDTGMVHAEIWGQPDDKDIRMSSEQVDTYEDNQGNPVTEWQTYKTVLRDGEVISSEVVSDDTYKYLKPAEESASAVRPPN